MGRRRELSREKKDSGDYFSDRKTSLTHYFYLEKERRRSMTFFHQDWRLLNMKGGNQHFSAEGQFVCGHKRRYPFQKSCLLLFSSLSGKDFWKKSSETCFALSMQQMMSCFFVESVMRSQTKSIRRETGKVSHTKRICLSIAQSDAHDLSDCTFTSLAIFSWPCTVSFDLMCFSIRIPCHASNQGSIQFDVASFLSVSCVVCVLCSLQHGCCFCHANDGGRRRQE